MTTKTPVTCGSCRYYENRGAHTWCRRYPPVAVDKHQVLFPTTHWDDWCGEWQPRINEES